jgi:hypothetical protein
LWVLCIQVQMPHTGSLVGTISVIQKGQWHQNKYNTSEKRILYSCNAIRTEVNQAWATSLISVLISFFHMAHHIF